MLLPRQSEQAAHAEEHAAPEREAQNLTPATRQQRLSELEGYPRHYTQLREYTILRTRTKP